MTITTAEHRYQHYKRLRENMTRTAEAAVASMRSTQRFLDRMREEQREHKRRSRAAKKGWKKRRSELLAA